MSDQQPDLSALLQQAQAMQEQLMAARAEVAEQHVDGKAAGGQVTVTVTGDMEFKAVHIAPELLDDAGSSPDNVALLEDLVLAALRDASSQVAELNQQAVGGMFG